MNEAGLGGSEPVGCHRGGDAKADVFGLQPRALQGLTGGGHGELGKGLPLPGKAPLPDAGAGDNPLIVGIHPACQVVVGHDPFRNRPAGAKDVQSVHVSLSSRTAPMARNF